MAHAAGIGRDRLFHRPPPYPVPANREFVIMGGPSGDMRPTPDLPAVSRTAVARPGDGVILTRSGLQLARHVGFERWLGVGRELAALSTSAAWCLGDWLAFGEKAYPSRYRHAIEQTSLEYQTLRNYAWVARQFVMSRRRDRLTFGHHAEVAALPNPEQDFWLRKAEQHQWSVKELRRQVRASLAERTSEELDNAEPGPADHDRGTRSLQISLSPRQLDDCQAAATNANMSLEAWTVMALEHAARHQLSCTETPRTLSCLQHGSRKTAMGRVLISGPGRGDDADRKGSGAASAAASPASTGTEPVWPPGTTKHDPAEVSARASR